MRKDRRRGVEGTGCIRRGRETERGRKYRRVFERAVMLCITDCVLEYNNRLLVSCSDKLASKEKPPDREFNLPAHAALKQATLFSSCGLGNHRPNTSANHRETPVIFSSDEYFASLFANSPSRASCVALSSLPSSSLHAPRSSVHVSPHRCDKWLSSKTLLLPFEFAGKPTGASSGKHGRPKTLSIARDEDDVLMPPSPGT